jgi:hypothetical protein
MYKKIEIWILYLVLVFVFISYIVFGALVRREIMKGSYIPIISPISKIALFIAEIPHNLKKIGEVPWRVPNGFNLDQAGFVGETHKTDLYLLLSRYDGDLNESIVELIDLKTFNILHKWNPQFNLFYRGLKKDEIFKHKRLKRDNNDRRSGIFHPLIDEFGSILFQSNGSPLLKINKNSNLEWLKSDESYHHSVEKNFEGNYWVCIWYYPYKIDSKYVGNKYGNYRNDGIRKISSDGNILFEKSMFELFVEHQMEYLLFSTTDDFKKDPIHLNDIQPVNENTDFWKKGDVFLSFRNLSLVILYRPETNEILWKSKPNKFFNQHDVNIVENNKISIFDNNMKFFFGSEEVDGNNRVVIYDFETDKYSTYLDKSLEKEDVRTKLSGRSQILFNGDLAIEESGNGRFLYFTSKGELKWTYFNRASDNKLYHLFWSRILYRNEDIVIVNNFLESMAK